MSRLRARWRALIERLRDRRPPGEPTGLAALAELFARGPDHVHTTIARGDGMFLGDRARYFAVGESALRCIKLALLAAGRHELRSILDLACGHGRVLRTLRAAFPDARLTACDIQPGGVDFCARTFGATPVYSVEEPDRIPLAGPFDLIWCGSLLTHLPAGRWAGYLDRLESVLEPGGLLVVTTHGRHVVERLRRGEDAYGLDPEGRVALLADFDRDGFGYRDYPGMERWGVSVSSPSWICDQLERRPGLRLLTFTERGWDDHQDVFACLRQPGGG